MGSLSVSILSRGQWRRVVVEGRQDGWWMEYHRHMYNIYRNRGEQRYMVVTDVDLPTGGVRPEDIDTRQTAFPLRWL